MRRAQALRVLRIPLAIGCLMACALSIVLWARSHAYRDVFVTRLTDTRKLTLQSNRGELSVTAFDTGQLWSHAGAWHLKSAPMPWIEEFERLLVEMLCQQPTAGSRRRFSAGSEWVCFPHWALVALAGAAAAALGIRRPFHFGLRSVLIVTTLVASVLELCVIATR